MKKKAAFVNFLGLGLSGYTESLVRTITNLRKKIMSPPFRFLGSNFSSRKYKGDVVSKYYCQEHYLLFRGKGVKYPSRLLLFLNFDGSMHKKN